MHLTEHLAPAEGSGEPVRSACSPPFNPQLTHAGHLPPWVSCHQRPWFLKDSLGWIGFSSPHSPPPPKPSRVKWILHTLSYFIYFSFKLLKVSFHLKVLFFSLLNFWVITKRCHFKTSCLWLFTCHRLYVWWEGLCSILNSSTWHIYSCMHLDNHI